MNVAIRNRAFSLPATETLILADRHVGRAEASTVDASVGERPDLCERLTALLAQCSTNLGSPLVDDFDAVRPVVYIPDAGESLSFPPLDALRRLR